MAYVAIMKKIRGLAAVTLLSVLTTGVSLADAVSEYDLKAAYLLNFASYVEWPSSQGPITICIYGENPFKATTIVSLLKEKQGRVDVTFTYPRQLGQLADCKILYLASSERDNFDQIIASLHNASVLIVSDIQDDLPAGVMINLLLESNRLAFEVRMNTVLAAKLKISSKLLKLAKSVQ